jgi:hypothetical protein
MRDPARETPVADVYVDCVAPHVPATSSVRVADLDFHLVFRNEDKRGVPFSFWFAENDGAADRRRFRYPRERRVWMAVESPVRPIFSRAVDLARDYGLVLTHWKPLLDRGPPFVLHPYGTTWLGGVDARASHPKSRLVSFLGSIRHPDGGGYDVRKRVATMLLADDRVECFGYGIRELPGKLPGLSPFAFSVAMENTREDFYFTEKLVDCLLTETVPVYWGCPSIGEIFDVRGIVVFETPDDLRAILDELTPDRYREMLPYVRANRDLALARDWASQEGLYRRAMARALEAGFDALSPPRLRPRMVDLARRTMTLWRGS